MLLDAIGHVNPKPCHAEELHLVLKAPEVGACSAKAGLHLVSYAHSASSPHMLQAVVAISQVVCVSKVCMSKMFPPAGLTCCKTVMPKVFQLMLSVLKMFVLS